MLSSSWFSVYNGICVFWFTHSEDIWFLFHFILLFCWNARGERKVYYRLFPPGLFSCFYIAILSNFINVFHIILFILRIVYADMVVIIILITETHLAINLCLFDSTAWHLQDVSIQLITNRLTLIFWLESVELIRWQLVRGMNSRATLDIRINGISTVCIKYLFVFNCLLTIKSHIIFTLKLITFLSFCLVDRIFFFVERHLLFADSFYHFNISGA